MAYIDLNQYISTPAAIFDLQSRCRLSQQGNAVPCRIKVGPRRWLSEHVIPEELGVTVWQEKNGQLTYLRNEPVQTSVDNDGILTVDMVTFAREYFGKNHISFCDSDHWQWHKNQAYSDTFLTTDHGIATHHSAWLDIDIHHSNLYLVPGTLNLCGHDVRHIYWETFCDSLAAPNESMRPVVEDLFSGCHTASAKDALKRLKTVKDLQDWGFNRLVICTDHGRFAIGVGLNPYLQINLKDSGSMADGYQPNRENTILKYVDILLQLLQATTADAVRDTLEMLYRNGLLVKGA